MNNMNQMNGNGFNPQQPQNNAGKFFLNFQPNDILQKEFKTKMRGYDQAEVDQFLDGIIKDYESYSGELNRLKAENNRLQSQLNSMPQNNQAANNVNQTQNQTTRRTSRTIPVQPKASTMSNMNNTASKTDASTYDILRRISNLEKHVFGHDFANGVSNQNVNTTKNDDTVKQFASAAVPNNNMNNSNVHNPFESGHNEINPDMSNMNNNNTTDPNNLNPNHFDAGRQNMGSFNPNLNNNGNVSQF
ncbi:MAG: cell division regulator GpsB [Companilactobacillus sp.]|jgi:DivIVA domain-containing protein|nr:cell division regulator GpsB [Companilactobacillus sp.]MCH4008250.1 cell division regulator GpsB [Companilactobacillus sp.]MCH4051571.1 cell division regulator GpsB [Companilactobacillus sp.]MCH4076193.1 cell division regulator GpsB [Companilactobacillus sp.]MCH4124768.1 cell division regulator GpsB [Companilactobacillus sp.]MCH4131310.1 cell division regulator GpsB [Companilactobacillus sp.]